MAAPKGHKYSVGNTGGRPPKYETEEELIAAVDAYFEYVEGEKHEEEIEVKNPKTGKKEKVKVELWDREPEPTTVTGLALFLGFCSRQSLADYEKVEKFSYIIKKAKMRVEFGYEKALQTQSPAGPIFALKNMGWKDKQEFEQTHNIGEETKAIMFPDGTRIEL